MANIAVTMPGSTYGYCLKNALSSQLGNRVAGSAKAPPIIGLDASVSTNLSINMGMHLPNDKPHGRDDVVEGKCLRLVGTVGKLADDGVYHSDESAEHATCELV